MGNETIEQLKELLTLIKYLIKDEEVYLLMYVSLKQNKRRTRIVYTDPKYGKGKDFIRLKPLNTLLAKKHIDDTLDNLIETILKEDPAVTDLVKEHFRNECFNILNFGRTSIYGVKIDTELNKKFRAIERSLDLYWCLEKHFINKNVIETTFGVDLGNTAKSYCVCFATIDKDVTYTSEPTTDENLLNPIIMDTYSNIVFNKELVGEINSINKSIGTNMIIRALVPINTIPFNMDNNSPILHLVVKEIGGTLKLVLDNDYDGMDNTTAGDLGDYRYKSIKAINRDNEIIYQGLKKTREEIYRRLVDIKKVNMSSLLYIYKKKNFRNDHKKGV